MKTLTALLICLPLAAQAYRKQAYIPLGEAVSLPKQLFHIWLDRCMDNRNAAGDGKEPPLPNTSRAATCAEIFAEEERRLKHCGTTGMCKHYHYTPVPTEFATFQRAGFEYLYYWAQACFEDKERLPLCSEIISEYKRRSTRCLELHNTPWCEAR